MVLIDSGIKPYDLTVKGHTPRPSDLLTAMLPGAKQILFSSIQGISLVDLKSGETLRFWRFEDQEKYEDIYSMLSPDGKTVVGFAMAKEPGVSYKNQAMYWLRLEP